MVIRNYEFKARVEDHLEYENRLLKRLTLCPPDRSEGGCLTTYYVSQSK